jgi:tetratricopeptide (TPR) repeat protein
MDFISEIITELLAYISRRKADYRFRRRKYKPASRNYVKAAERYLALDEHSKVGFAYRRIAECYHEIKVPLKEEERKNFRTTIAYYSKAAEAFMAAGEHLHAGDCYENASKTYDELLELDKAVDYALRSVVEYEKSGDMLSTSHAYLYTAVCQEKVGRLDDAAGSYGRAGELNMQISDYRRSASSYIKAAGCYRNVGLLDKALSALANSTNASLKMRDYSQMSQTYGEMAELHLKMGDFKNAVYYHKKAAELRFDNQEYSESGLSYFRIGELHESKKDYRNALDKYLQSAQVSLNAKKFEQAAVAYEMAGDCYEKLGDMLKASEYYVYAAKTNTSAGKTKEAAKAYDRAAKNLAEQAEARFIEKDFKSAAFYFEKAVECYTSMEDYFKAGGIYVKKAEAHARALEGENARDSYINAAESYLKAGDLKSAGYDYKMAGEYGKSAQAYLRYAEKKNLENDDLQTGEGYKQAGRAYSKYGADAERRESYNKAIFYFEKIRKGKSSLKDQRQMADSSESAGECYLDMSDFKNAEHYFAEAAELYSGTGFTLGENLSNAFLNKVKGELSMELGRHAEAIEMLKKSLDLFGVSMASGRFDGDFTGYLEEQKQTVENLIYKIERKPDIELLADKQSYTFTDTLLVVNAVLNNNGSYPIYSINFLSHLPDEFKVSRPPVAIKELKPKESAVVSAELTVSTAGDYIITPFEIFYSDDRENKYVKASNESSIVVDERPPDDFKNFRLAVEVYLRYARMQLSNKNYFYAGEGFKKAAEVYGRFNTDERLKEYYQSAIKAFSEYIKTQAGDTADLVLLERTGDAFWSIAETSDAIGLLDDAIGSYGKASVYYGKSGVRDKESIVNALVAKTEAKKAIEHGDYARASEMLSTTIEYFNEALNKGGLDASKIKFIQRHNSEANTLVDKIKNIPVVALNVNAPGEVPVGKPFTVEAVLMNLSDLTLRDIRFIMKAPEDFAVKRAPPQLSEAPPRSTKSVSIELAAAKKGGYSFKPLDVFYTDDKNNGYMHGSNKVSINVVEEKSPEGTAESVGGEPEGKPDVAIRLSDPPMAIREVALRIPAVLENNSAYTVTGLRFLVNAPPDFDVLETPEVIKELKDGARESLSISLLPHKEGTYTFRPVEIFYRDSQGNRFFKSSGDVTVRVLSAEMARGVSSATIEAGMTYLLEDEDRTSSIELVKKQTAAGCAVLYVTRINPAQIVAAHNLTDVKFIWMTDVKEEGAYATSSSPQDISISISDFIDSNKKTFILLEGFEYLIDHSGFTLALEFLKFQRDKVSKKDSRLLILLDPNALETKQLQRLEHECILYVK